MKCREQIRENIEAGYLPRDLDVTQLIVGHPPLRSTCAGCGETFLVMIQTLLLTPAPAKITGFIKIAKSFGRKSDIGQH